MAVMNLRNRLLLSFFIVAAMWIQPSRQEIKICDNSLFTVKIQCFCRVSYVEDVALTKAADCWIADPHIPPDDKEWDSFKNLTSLEKIKFTIKGEGRLKFVPTKAIENIPDLLGITIKLGTIQTIEPFAFANLSFLETLTLTGNEIRYLRPEAFTNHPRLLTITLDRNRVQEIQKNVFHKLHSLQKLYMTSNNITTIHDHVFEHLKSLTELELDKNSIFVLTKDTFAGLKNLMRLELSTNKVQVIGENTFTHLHNLRELRLDYNLIEVVDPKAFNGLSKLLTLTLAGNKIKHFDSNKIFQPIKSIVYLSIKDNLLRNLTRSVIEPVLKNFFVEGSKFEFSGNNFTCDCNLNWFEELKNNSKSGPLVSAIDIMQCYPDPLLAEEFSKTEEMEPIEEEKKDDDYYTEEDLNGTIFFFDIPDSILPCQENNQYKKPQIQITTLKPSITETPTTVTTTSTTIPKIIPTQAHLTSTTSSPTTASYMPPSTYKTSTSPPRYASANIKERIEPPSTITRLHNSAVRNVDRSVENEMNDEEMLNSPKLHMETESIYSSHRNVHQTTPKPYSPPHNSYASHNSLPPSQITEAHYNKPASITKDPTGFTPTQNIEMKNVNSLSAISKSSLLVIFSFSLLYLVLFR